jgi:hypothetical protein
MKDLGGKQSIAIATDTAIIIIIITIVLTITSMHPYSSPGTAR